MNHHHHSIPILTGTLKLGQHAAHGTSLCAVLACGFGGAVSYGLAGAMDLQVGFCKILAVLGQYSNKYSKIHILHVWT